MSVDELDDLIKNSSALQNTQRKVERNAALKKYNQKFEEKFHNHFDGEVRLERESRRSSIQILKGTGGHNHAVIGDNVIVRRYLTEAVDDMPFDALISVRYGNGQWLEKAAKSMMFPKNWDITRVKEEIALVYDKMIKSGKFEELRYRRTPKYNNLDSTGNFRINIEFDTFGNLTNAFPLKK